MKFFISYRRRIAPDNPKSPTAIVVFPVERDEEPSIEEATKLVEQHSKGEFIPDSIKIEERR